MESALLSPASTWFWFIPAFLVYTLIPVCGITVFTYEIVKRLEPLYRAAPDDRWTSLPARFLQLGKIWLLQRRHPRYMAAGVLHILLFTGFLILSLRSLEMMFIGIAPGFTLPGLGGAFGSAYRVLSAYACTWVLVVVVIAMIRRGIVRPARYEVPAKYGKSHTAEALLVLTMICLLVVSESLFEGSLAAAQLQQGGAVHFLPPLSLSWIFSHLLSGRSLSLLQGLHSGSYFIHDVTFFTFLCILPLGKHFHVVTSLFNVFFMRLRRGNIKPVRYGLDDAQLEKLESFGVKFLKDFTWKHVLDFYSCVDCGRCSDNCPANAAGRPLSPRFISIKARNLIYSRYPLDPRKPRAAVQPLIGTTYDENEVWSCTTCGACEQECPVGIEYIDKIVDLRRGMVDDGNVPQSLQKPLGALEKRGNPWGKMEKKRADWTKELGEDVPVRILTGEEPAEILYFVDSITSYDDRMQSIARATATILHHAGVDFGILGKEEKDSGNEVRRFGEEMLFQNLRDHNSELIKESGANLIVTADPHSLNALKNDYSGLPPVEHISQFAARQLRAGRLRLKPLDGAPKAYVYHDPCYLGRHNGIYNDPRAVLDAIPGMRRVEMPRSRDRSFCCGGGGLMLFYEPEEEQRMGVLRVRMAREAGAQVIVTACPFCLVNIEDAIKVAGLEGELQAIDLAELIADRLARPAADQAGEEGGRQGSAVAAVEKG